MGRNLKMNNKSITVKFEGIDWWNRPIFKDINSNARYGSTEILYDYCEDEKTILNEITEKDLTYFGNSFDCEPIGTLITNIKIIQ